MAMGRISKAEKELLESLKNNLQPQQTDLEQPALIKQPDSPVQKPKRVVSEKTRLALEAGRKKRQENMQAKKRETEAIVQQVMNEKEEAKKVKQEKFKQKVKQIIQEPDDESDDDDESDNEDEISDEEIIEVAKPKSSKKKKPIRTYEVVHRYEVPPPTPVPQQILPAGVRVKPRRTTNTTTSARSYDDIFG